MEEVPSCPQCGEHVVEGRFCSACGSYLSSEVPVGFPAPISVLWTRQPPDRRRLIAWFGGIGATILLVIIVATSGGDEDRSNRQGNASGNTIRISCYDLMNTTVITELASTKNNDYQFEKCQQPGMDNTVVTMDRAER